MLELHTTGYLAQRDRWPPDGKHILAQWDEATIIVYQAYRPSIADFAVNNGAFGGDFSFSRMSWIKPNFLWMMYRSQWGTTSGQEVVLAIVLRRTFFDALLAQAVPSSFDSTLYPTRESWHAAVDESDVRLQWDPDHLPSGAPLARRAIQLGLRRAALAGWNGDDLLGVHDISEFVAQQRVHAQAPFTHLVVPTERAYPVEDPEARKRLGL